MAPMTSAAHLRTPLRNILADEILMEKDFAPAVLPDELSKQLDPNTRAVTVYVMKEHCAGGTIRVGEFVDVLLTTKINYDDKEELRTACIARACKVVMKRNTPWQVMAADPDDKPLPFTLQANPYRAALIQYAHTMGQISLQPVPAPPRSTGSFTDLSSPEYATEDKKVEEITQGTRLIGTEDLVRIF
jgi:Flp pilus assembly protein CpaB